MRLTSSMAAPTFSVIDVTNVTQTLEQYRGKPLLISFMRFASCPFCNLRLWYLQQRYDILHAQGLQIVIIFESSPEVIKALFDESPLPFPIIADPTRALYQMYGVEQSWQSWFKSLFTRIPEYFEARRLGLIRGKRDGSLIGLPADFLIDTNQRIHTAYYGSDIADHLPFECIEAMLQSSPLPVDIVG